MERLTDRDELRKIADIYSRYCNIMTVPLCYDAFDCLQSLNSHNIWVSNKTKDILCHLDQHVAVWTYFITLLLWFPSVHACWFPADTNHPVNGASPFYMTAVLLISLIPLTAGISSTCLLLRVDARLDEEKKHTMYSVGSVAGLTGRLPGQSWPEPAKHAVHPCIQMTGLGWHDQTSASEMARLTLVEVPGLPLKSPCVTFGSSIFQSHDKITCQSFTCAPVAQDHRTVRGKIHPKTTWNLLLLIQSSQTSWPRKASFAFCS